MTAKETSFVLPYVVDIAFQAGDIVFATDKQGLVVYWSKEAEEISGFKAEEALGQPYAIACRMEPGLAVPDVASVLGGRDFAGGVRCHSRSGGEAALYLFATAGRNRSGEPAGVVFVGRDVTDLWRAEQAAQASTDKYRVLFENTQDSVAIADIDGRVLEANPACLRLYGYTADEVKVMNLADVVAPEDRGAARAAMASLALGRPVTKTIRLRRKDGTRFVVDLLASVIAVGGERRIVSVTRDVTERVRAEQAKSQSERMYRAVFESANDAVFIESIDGRILDVNRRGCEMFGYRRDELVRKSVSDLVPAEARGWLPHVTDAILRDGTFRTEAVNVHKNGRHIPVEISASTMEHDGRTVILAIVRDITRRKLDEQALRESEEKFRSVAEQSPNMIFVNSRGRVVYANRKSADVMGYTQEEFYAPGFDFMKLIAPESVDRIKSVYARHARGEEVEPYEYSLVTKDGRRIESIITTKLIDFDGARSILGIVTDITERRAAERALLESERQYRTALDAMHDPVHVADADLRIVMVNQAFLRWLAGRGIDDAVLGKTVFDAFPFLPAKVRDEYRHVFESGGPLVTEEETSVAGRTFFTETTKVPVTEGDKVVRVLTVVRDTTERRTVELALRESEDRYRTLFDDSLTGIYRTTPDGRILLANPALVRMLGYDSFAQLAERNLEADGSRPDCRRDEFKRRLERDGRIVGLEVGWQTRDGRTLSVRENARAVRGPDGAVLYYEGTVEDITDRKAAEQALRQEKELAHSYLEVVGVIMVVLDEAGAVKLINQKGCAVLGGASGDIVGRNWFDTFVPERLRDQVRQVFAGLMSGQLEPLENYENPVVTLRGEERLVAWHNALLRDEAGRVVGTLSSGEDVTERRELAREATTAAAQAQAVLDNSPGAIAAECEGKLVYANQRFVRMFGYDSPEQVVGRPASEFDAPEDRAKLTEYSRIRERGGDAPTSYVFRGLKRDGTTAPLEARISTYRSLGRLHILASIREVEPVTGSQS